MMMLEWPCLIVCSQRIYQAMRRIGTEEREDALEEWEEGRRKEGPNVAYRPLPSFRQW
jgi:hypothetical protein